MSELPFHHAATSQERVAVLVRIWVKERDVVQLLKTIRKYLPATVDDGGLVYFATYQHLQDSQQIILYEEWDTTEAFEQSLRSPWRDEYLADTRDLWLKPREFETWQASTVRWRDDSA